MIQPGRNPDLESIPGHPAVALVPLLGPVLVGAQQRPLGIVEVRVRPGWVISCVEAPKTIERCNRHTVVDEIEGLRAQPAARNRQQRKQERDLLHAMSPGPGSLSEAITRWAAFSAEMRRCFS